MFVINFTCWCAQNKLLHTVSFIKGLRQWFSILENHHFALIPMVVGSNLAYFNMSD